MAGPTAAAAVIITGRRRLVPLRAASDRYRRRSSCRRRRRRRIHGRRRSRFPRVPPPRFFGRPLRGIADGARRTCRVSATPNARSRTSSPGKLATSLVRSIGTRRRVTSAATRLMDDSELDALRAKRMAQMQAENGGRPVSGDVRFAVRRCRRGDRQAPDVVGHLKARDVGHASKGKSGGGGMYRFWKTRETRPPPVWLSKVCFPVYLRSNNRDTCLPTVSPPTFNYRFTIVINPRVQRSCFERNEFSKYCV